MYLSYLMGAPKITDEELKTLGVEIVSKSDSGSRRLKIPSEKIDDYRKLVIEKLDLGFWNEYLDEKNIHFIFKSTSGDIQEYLLAPDNEKEISKRCSEFNGDPIEKTANVYKYIFENEFYSGTMEKYYKEMISR